MRIKSIFTNSSGILFSRVFGFIRDLLMASVLGANLYSDIFFVAFKLPNLFRRVFAEGAFAQSFLPSFIASRYKSLFATRILITFLLSVIVLSILINIFALPITKVIAPGFSGDTLLITAKFLAIQFWYLPLIFLVTFFASLLQYKEHFAVTAFSTVLLNIALIVALLISKDMPKEKTLAILSYSVLIGGALQLIAHLIVAKYLRVLKIISVGFSSLKGNSKRVKSDIERFYKNFFPAIWGNSTAQVMAFLDTWLASFLVSGSISYLYYANRIFQLPLAIFAIALSTALFPTIAKKIKHSDEISALMELKRGFWILLFLLTLATIGGVIFAKEIIWLLFERGAFSRSDTLNSALVLQMYMIGLLPFGLSKLFNLWLYSTHKQLKAAKIATFALSVYTIFAFLLFIPLGAKGLALSGSISAIFSFIYLIYIFGFDKFKALFDRRLFLIYLATTSLATTIFFSLHLFLVKAIGLN